MGLISVLLLGGLAVWRLALLITEEEGPFELFDRIRAKIDPYQKTWLGRGVRCVWCVSFWLGWAVAGAFWYLGFLTGTEFPFAALAFSSVTILANQTVKRG